MQTFLASALAILAIAGCASSQNPDASRVYRNQQSRNALYQRQKPWRPDLVVTDSPSAPSTENVTEIIECKHRRCLDSATDRSEFAKRYDLKVPSYLICSYFDASPKVIAGANRLGLLVKPIGLGCKDRVLTCG
jgi:hypothetical protein